MKIKSAFVGLALVSATATVSAKDIMSDPPAEGLPFCAGVYAAIASYSEQPARRILLTRANQILDRAQVYSPRAQELAVATATVIRERVDANDPEIVGQITRAETRCRAYVAQYEREQM